jgi:predicted kinase
MLRASFYGKNGPNLICGLANENIERLKAGFPIKAELKTFAPNMPGNLLIMYGETHAAIEAELLKLGAIGEETLTSADPRLDQLDTITRDYDHILICTVGLPRSGKSTWAKQQAWPVVNPDSIRLAMHGQAFLASMEPYVWAIARTMVRSLFLAGHKRVILDATNVTKKRRQEWRSTEWATFYKEFHTPIETCKKRAAESGREDLVSVIDRMYDQLEILDDGEKLWP